MTFRDGQARGPRNHATSACCRAPPFSWVALALLTAACADEASPEQQVRAVIESMEVAAEARDVGDLMEHISANYRDAQGQDRTEASRYARGYFIANQSVHLLTRIESLEFPSPDEARVKLQVGMAGRGGEPGAAEPQRRPVRLRPRAGPRGRRVEGQLRGLAGALTQVSTSVICDRSSGLYSTGRRRSAPCNACAEHASRADEPR